MIYLLLKRDFEIFRICQKKVINVDELWDAAECVLSNLFLSPSLPKHQYDWLGDLCGTRES
jgi:hypothetical protein